MAIGARSRRVGAAPFWVRLRLRLFVLVSTVLAQTLLSGPIERNQDGGARPRAGVGDERAH